MANLSDIFDWFSVGRTPTAQQFRDTFSSFFHKSEKLPQTAIYGLTDDLNDKASKNDLANATTKFKGYHTSLDLLQAEYPQASNKKDFYAWVGTPYPGTVYKVYADGGAWTDTGEVPTQQEIDLAEYVKKQTIYNVSQTNNNYAYVDKQTARNAVPSDKRKRGQIISYQLVTGEVVTEQFIGDDVTNWWWESFWRSDRQYLVTWGLGLAPLVLSDENDNIVVKIRHEIYVFNIAGVEVARTTTIEAAKPSYTLKPNEILYFNIKNLSFEIKKFANVIPPDVVIICYNNSGYACGGIYQDIRSQYQSKLARITYNDYSLIKINTIAKTLTIPKDIIVRCGDKAYYSFETDFVLSLNNPVSSNMNLVFDISQEKFSLQSYWALQKNDNIFIVANIHIPTGYCSLDHYIINDIPNYSYFSSSLEMEQIVWTQEPSVVRVDGTTDLKVAIKGTMYIVLNSGKQLLSHIYDANATNDYIVPTNNVLLYDVANKKFVVQNNNANRLGFILLLSNYSGRALNGQITKSINQLTSTYVPNYFVTHGGGELPDIKLAGNTIRVRFRNSIYIADKDGRSVASKSFNSTNNEYVVNPNYQLIFNIDNAGLELISNNAVHPFRYVLLINNAWGQPTSGQLMNAWFASNSTIQKRHATTLSKFVKKADYTGSQGMTIIKNELWSFHASNSENTNIAYIERKDLDNNYERLTPYKHNLGHAASADYSLNYDVLMVANGGDRPRAPRLDLILNTSQLIGSSIEQIIDFNDKKRVLTIKLHTDKKQIGGSGSDCIACFGEDKNMVYILTAGNTWLTPQRIFKGILGTGDNDFSDKSANKDDATAWGTFISGKGENEFNGTLKILSSYTGDILDTYQGCCFKDGYLWLSMGMETPRVAKIKCYFPDFYRVEDMIDFQMHNPDGTLVEYEPEGICFNNEYLLMTIISNTRPNQLIAIPVFGKQGGIGTIGQKTKFDFLVNHNPNIQITPLSAVNDLYIDSIDSDGFTVKSVSGGSGSFNWTACV